MHTTTSVTNAMTAALAASTTAILAALAPIAPLPQTPAADDAITDYLESRFEANGVPGAAYAVVDADGIRSHTWGTDGDGDPIGVDTPFLWGSVAKPVTATAVMTLVEDGLIDLDRPVVEYLPDFTLADPGRSDRITVRHLLEQSSGIPEGTGITDRFETRDDPYGDAVADLADVEPFAEPGEVFEYASANYVVAGAVVEAAADMPYADYLRANVLDPLSMTGAITTVDEAEAVPRGHAVVFGQAVPIDTGFDPAGPSYGYLGGTVEDLAAFAADQLTAAADAESAVLTTESLAHMHTGAVEVSDTIDYGLGWRVDTRNADLGTTTVWHTGAAPGYAAGAILLPELGRAIVVAQNLYGHFQEGELIGAMLGAARILAGGEAVEPETDLLYPGMLVGLTVLLLAALFVLVRTLLRIRKGRNSRPGLVLAGMACWIAAALAVAYVAFVLVPGLAPSRAALFGIAPDLAWLLTGLGTIAILLAGAKVWSGLARLRS